MLLAVLVLAILHPKAQKELLRGAVPDAIPEREGRLKNVGAFDEHLLEAPFLLCCPWGGKNPCGKAISPVVAAQ